MRYINNPTLFEYFKLIFFTIFKLLDKKDLFCFYVILNPFTVPLFYEGAE